MNLLPRRQHVPAEIINVQVRVQDQDIGVYVCFREVLHEDKHVWRVRLRCCCSTGSLLKASAQLGLNSREGICESRCIPAALQSRFISILSSSWPPDLSQWPLDLCELSWLNIRIHGRCMRGAFFVVSHWQTFPSSSFTSRIYLILGSTPVLVCISFLNYGGRMLGGWPILKPFGLIKLSCRCQILPIFALPVKSLSSPYFFQCFSEKVIQLILSLHFEMKAQNSFQSPFNPHCCRTALKC